MGRPLNNKFFGPEAGKLRIRYHNGSSVVDGYVVKQMGSIQYLVSTDGINNFVVNLAQQDTLAQNLTAGYATFAVQDANGNPAYIKNLMTNSAVTTSGDLAVWSADPDAEDSLVVPVKPPMTTLTNSRLSAGAFSPRGQDSVWFGQIGNKGTNYQIQRNETLGLELGIKVHQYLTSKSGPVTGPDEDGVISVTVPAEALVTTNGVRRTTWVFDYSVLAGLNGTGSTLNDFDIVLRLDLDPSTNESDLVITRLPDSTWAVTGAGIIPVDSIMATSGANLNLVNQDSQNIGYSTIDPLRPVGIPNDWASQAGQFMLSLTASQDGEVVALLKVKVITDPNATWI